jgi:putative transposase
VPYWSIHFHLVWSTKGRESFLVGSVAEMAEQSLRANCRDHKVVVHALSVMPEHVHLAVSVPPSLSVSTLVSRLKGSSSHLIRHADIGANPDFSWQSEYGVLSFGEKQLPEVMKYIQIQESRHAAGKLWDKLEQWSDAGQPASAGFVDVARGLSPANKTGTN